MNVVYATQPINKNVPSIFLAGPTPRKGGPPSWRPEALDMLRDLGFKGDIFVPEPEGSDWPEYYDDQVDWEDAGLHQATIIVIWVPRSQALPGFTTNVEFGLWLKSGKMLYGRPDGAERTRYLDYMYKKVTEKSPHNDLRRLLEEAVWLCGMSDGE